MKDKKGNIETLKDRHVYKIHARNAHYGIWIAENKSFLISRWKFGENYPFEEYERGYKEFLDEFTRFFKDPGRFTYTPAILCRGRKPFI